MLLNLIYLSIYLGWTAPAAGDGHGGVDPDAAGARRGAVTWLHEHNLQHQQRRRERAHVALGWAHEALGWAHVAFSLAHVVLSWAHLAFSWA